MDHTVVHATAEPIFVQQILDFAKEIDRDSKLGKEIFFFFFKFNNGGIICGSKRSCFGIRNLKGFFFFVILHFFSLLSLSIDFHVLNMPAKSNVLLCIKLRPLVREFFERIKPLYEMHIYTNGSRDYAEAVAKVLDPDGTVFHHRIVSRYDFISMVSFLRLCRSNSQ